MNPRKLLTAILFLLTLTACNSNGLDQASTDSESPVAFGEGNLGVSCELSKDCMIPGEYLIQSNCPFQSVCFEGSCQIACPFAPEPRVCSADSDCDCTARGERSKECVCLSGKCLSIETNE